MLFNVKRAPLPQLMASQHSPRLAIPRLNIFFPVAHQSNVDGCETYAFKYVYRRYTDLATCDRVLNVAVPIPMMDIAVIRSPQQK